MNICFHRLCVISWTGLKRLQDRICKQKKQNRKFNGNVWGEAWVSVFVGFMSAGTWMSQATRFTPYVTHQHTRARAHTRRCHTPVTVIVYYSFFSSVFFFFFYISSSTFCSPTTVLRVCRRILISSCRCYYLTDMTMDEHSGWEGVRKSVFHQVVE